jgi:LmbE family N-acetylglucosaminyl deacetylase
MHGLRPLVPPVGLEILQTVQSHARGGALVAAPVHKRVLVLAPHPDDEVIGCGATAALLSDDGRQLRTLIATEGENLPVPGVLPADVGARRRADALRAAGILGTPPPVFLGFEDGTLPETVRKLSAAISEHVGEFRPDAIYAPWLLDGHPDHQAVARAVAFASVPATTEIWGYEVWAPAPANRLVDVTKVWDRKERALAAHSMPASVFDTTGHLALNRWRSVHGSGGSGYMEAFLGLPFSSYKALALRLEAEPGAT